MSARNRGSDLTGTPGKPMIFGTRTPALMYLAIHPGCTSKEACAALGWSPRRWASTITRLRPFGVISGRWYYSLNPNVENFVEFRAFLRALAAAHGLKATSGKIGSLKAIAERHTAPHVPIPNELVFGKQRRKVLMAIACLTETFGMELARVVKLPQGDIRFNLIDLMNEGYLRRRVVGSAHLYSFDPAAPGALELKTLLRRMAFDSWEMRQGVQAALLRRELQHVQMPNGAGKTAKKINQPDRHISGTRRYRALYARRKFVSIRGDRRFWGKRRSTNEADQEPPVIAGVQVAQTQRRSYVLSLRRAYAEASKKRRAEMLDAVVSATGYRRPYAKLLLLGRSLS